MISWELVAATVILIVSLAVAFTLLRYAVILRTLEDTQRILRIQQEITNRLLLNADPRAVLEMDLPLKDSAALGGEILN